MNQKHFLLPLLIVFLLTACGTFRDPTDPYARGLNAYEQGNFALARSEWEPASKKGDCDTQYRLGLLHFLGQGTQRDTQVAVLLWAAAADRGQPRAQYALGDINFNSPRDTRYFCRHDCDSIKKDLASAYKWYLLAQKYARTDDDKSYVESVLPKIRSKLTPQEKTAGERQAARWKPTPAECKARSY